MRLFQSLFHLLCGSSFLLLEIVATNNGDIIVSSIGWFGAVVFAVLFSFACLWD